MLLRVALLVLCVLLLFVCIRLCEWLSWLESDRLPLQLVDPFALSVRELQALLEARGIAHDDLLEKTELVDAVENSGGLSTEEGEVLLADISLQPSLNFTSERHFLEEVEDSKSTVWAVRVVPHGHHPFPAYPLWNSIAKRLGRVGVQTGTFHCPRHNSWCLRQGWKIVPTLILAMPAGPDHNPRIEIYQGKPVEKSIVSWVYDKLEDKVERLVDDVSYERWLGGSTPVKMLHHTDKGCKMDKRALALIPAFFSALAVQFIGKVSFAVMDTSNNCKDRTLRVNTDRAKSVLLIKTPEFTHIYGSRKGELFHHDALTLFMTSLTPTSNDLFILALMLINYSCIFEIFLSQGNIARRLFRTLWFMAKGNFLLCSLWLPLISLFQISQLKPFIGSFMSVYRTMMNSDFAALLRHDTLLLSRFPILVLATVGLSVLIISLLDRKLGLGIIRRDDIQLPFLDFMPTVEHLVHFDPITWPLYTTRVSEVPDEKWLQKCVDELMTTLPTWDYGSCNCEDAMCLGCFPEDFQTSAECPICLEPWKDEVIVCGLPCSHAFHKSCTEAWMTSECENRWKCPMCREPIF